MSKEESALFSQRRRFLWRKVSKRQLIGSQDDSVIAAIPCSNLAPPETRRVSRDDSDLKLSMEKARARGTVSRLGLFRKKVKKRKDHHTRSPEARTESNNETNDARPPRDVAFRRNVSFESEVSIQDHVDSSPLRSILKQSVPHKPEQQRAKPQLMHDPTHMPYNPKLFQHLPVDYTSAVTANHQHAALVAAPPPPAPPGAPVQEQADLSNSSHHKHGGLSDSSSSYSESDFAIQNFPEAPVPQGPPGTRGQRARYSVYQGAGTFQKKIKPKFRVRPYHRFPDGRQMTEEEIYADSLKPSKTYEQIKSYLAPTSKSTKKITVPPEIEKIFGSPQQDGRIGAIRLEVLGCISLNRTKPDVGVYLVCGDAAFCTDVLTGYRSPMWPCESRRAALFPIQHAYAQVFVGVFDMRVRKNNDNDVFCGRVVFDVASLRPDTEYDVTMPLRYSKFVYDRRKRGVIRLRFSMHWFSERAAVVSYFKSAKSIAQSAPFVEGYPTIPCADPKTFRNVAVTVHGHDLPGKYSRTAFKSTIRELNLYQQNFHLQLKYLALDAVLYERWWVSLYLWVAGMYCASNSAFWLLPPFFVGYLLTLFLINYQYYVLQTKYNMGYKPLTLHEICNALVDKPDAPQANFEPITIQKKTKRRQGQAALSGDEDDGADSDEEIPSLDHREFPFSERDAYPKFSVEHALAPSQSNKGGGNSRLHGRLSVYYATPATAEDDNVGGDDDEVREDDQDDETIIGDGDGDGIFNLDSDSEDEEEDEEKFKSAASLLQSSSEKRRIKAGPPQDCDISGKKVPPQLMLQKMEKTVHKATMKFSVELVSAPLSSSTLPQEASLAFESTSMMSIGSGDSSDAFRKKGVYDAFDRLLGLETRSANPVHRISSSFLGPVMRMMRVANFLVRIFFHISTWRDPYLSFWAFVFLLGWLFLLLIFPWRRFFLLLTMVSFGPQNIFLRKFLEVKAAEKDVELENGSEQSLDGQKDPPQQGTFSSDKLSESVHSTGHAETARRRWQFAPSKIGQIGQNVLGFGRDVSSTTSTGISMGKVGQTVLVLGRDASSTVSRERLASSELFEEGDRPAFRSELRGQTTGSRKTNPRAVAIPYGRLKKDRFFDWPPDPTVSRATAMPFRETVLPAPAKTPSGQTAPSDDVTSPPSLTSETRDLPRGLRRRFVEKEIKAKYGYSD